MNVFGRHREGKAREWQGVRQKEFFNTPTVRALVDFVLYTVMWWWCSTWSSSCQLPLEGSGYFVSSSGRPRQSVPRWPWSPLHTHVHLLSFCLSRHRLFDIVLLCLLIFHTKSAIHPTSLAMPAHLLQPLPFPPSLSHSPA